MKYCPDCNEEMVSVSTSLEGQGYYRCDDCDVVIAW